MLKRLLLTACLLSSTYGADITLIIAGAFPPNSLTTVIVHTDQLNPCKIDHTTTKHVQLSGNVYFQPLLYKELNHSLLPLNM